MAEKNNKDKMVQFLYNNFPTHFVSSYFPTLYFGDISKVVVPVYYYSGQVNFGDLITPYLLKRLCDPAEYQIIPETTTKGPKLLSLRLYHEIGKQDVCSMRIWNTRQTPTHLSFGSPMC